MMRRALPCMAGMAGSMLAWVALAQNAPTPAVATNTPAVPAVQAEAAPTAPTPVTNAPAIPAPPPPASAAPAPAAPVAAPAVPAAQAETAPGAPVVAPSAPAAIPAGDASAATQATAGADAGAPAQPPANQADVGSAPANPIVMLPEKPIDPMVASPATSPDGKVLFNDMADNWQISVMFPPAEARKFERFMLAKKRRANMATPGGNGMTPGGGTLDENAEPPPPPSPTEAPAFYLSTIIYKGENQWAVWLRGQKFTPDNLDDGTVKIINVTKQRATFEWLAEGLDVISPNWEEKMKDNKQVKVKDDKKTVVFSLFSNQSFVSRVMKVIEGRAESTPIGDVKDEKTADGSVPADAAAPGDGRFDTQVPPAPPTTPATPEAANPAQAPQPADSVSAANAKAEKLKQAEKAIKGLLDPMKPSNHPGVDALENKPPAEAPTGPAKDAASAFKDRVNNGIVNPDNLPAPASAAPTPAPTTTTPATVTP